MENRPLIRETDDPTESSWEDLHPDEFLDDNDDEEEDEEEEKESASWFQELSENWTQHALAIVVAIVATVLAYNYQTRARIDDNVPMPFSYPVPTLDHIVMEYEPHEHLNDYARTSNITFCGDIHAKPMNHLVVMDFHVPKKLIPALEAHYYADVRKDIDYTNVFESIQQKQPLPSHSQLDCIENLSSSTSISYIRGLTHYFKDPSIYVLYPDYDPAKEAKMSANGLEEKPLLPAQLTFTGFGVKFFNLSPKPVLLYWDGRDERKLLGEIAPFESLGTATTPGQSFSVTPVYDSSHAMARWIVTADEVTLYFDPMDDNQVEKLAEKEKLLYNMQKLNQEFAKHYLIHAKRAWLGQFPRAFPLHPMWDTLFIGQKHTYIDEGEGRNYELRVESVLPKVLTIANFLSNEECDGLIQLALKEGLESSTVYSGSQARHTRDASTRSSENTWLERGNITSITDKVYRRAARLLRMDEVLFQKPVDDNVQAHHHSIAESLQVVRYRTGEQYTAHHDFVYPSQQLWYQPTRFATLLLYLNDDFTGGHTVFPRAVTRDLHDGVRVQPKKGTAVLFYSILPDGNVDDRSQHSSEPVKSGEKVRQDF